MYFSFPQISVVLVVCLPSLEYYVDFVSIYVLLPCFTYIILLPMMQFCLGIYFVLKVDLLFNHFKRLAFALLAPRAHSAVLEKDRQNLKSTLEALQEGITLLLGSTVLLVLTDEIL
jgi:hypothetical protein